jgi:hypothetical protein
MRNRAIPTIIHGHAEDFELAGREAFFRSSASANAAPLVQSTPSLPVNRYEDESLRFRATRDVDAAGLGLFGIVASLGCAFLEEATVNRQQELVRSCGTGIKAECCKRRTRKRAAAPVSVFRYFDFRVRLAKGWKILLLTYHSSSISRDC